MSNFKNLLSEATEGLSKKSPAKVRFGLKNFIKASTDQMLMTRGGYGQLGRQCGVHYIMNCPEGECQQRNSRVGFSGRNNGSSNFSLTEAVNAGWQATTSPGGLGWSVAAGWVKRSPIGFIGSFTVGYYNNLVSQFKSNYNYGLKSNTKVKGYPERNL